MEGGDESPDLSDMDSPKDRREEIYARLRYKAWKGLRNHLMCSPERRGSGGFGGWNASNLPEARQTGTGLDSGFSGCPSGLPGHSMVCISLHVCVVCE